MPSWFAPVSSGVRGLDLKPQGRREREREWVISDRDQRSKIGSKITLLPETSLVLYQ